MKIKSQKDFFSGLMFLVIGLAFAMGATNYTVGTGARMGPGYFPLLLGVLLAILGTAICFTGLTKGPSGGDKIGKWAWKQVFFILAANFAFGVLLVGVPNLGIPQFGLIVAIYALVFIASLGGHELQVQGSGNSVHRPGCGQLCGIRLGTEASVPRLAQFHHRLSRSIVHGTFSEPGDWASASPSLSRT